MYSNSIKTNPKNFLGYLMAFAMVFFTYSVSAQTTHIVTTVGMEFSPDSITIEKGDIVKWTNLQAGFHNVNGTNGNATINPPTGNAEFFSSGSPGTVDEYEFTFSLAGGNFYQCDPHTSPDAVTGLPSGMIGYITVTESSSDVTFSVDMSGQTVSAAGVHIAGSFNNWDPSATEMLDADGDGVYSVTLSLDQGSSYEYKFVNGDTWGSDEVLPSWENCQINGNRSFTVGTNATEDVAETCFQSCIGAPLNADCSGACDAGYVADANGNCVAASACANAGETEITLTLTDSYGDSWNGNTLTVNGVVYDQPTLYSGSSWSGAASDVYVVCVDLSTCIDVTF
jgi:plastocyanin